jgi:hypothetical protein
MTTRDDEPVLNFAAIEKWPNRWNKISPSAPVAAIDTMRDKTMLTTCLGWVMFDLHEDGPHILRQLEAACDLLRKELA